MRLGSMRAILLFMIFIMRYISRFLPSAEEEPTEEEKKMPEADATQHILQLF